MKKNNLQNNYIVQRSRPLFSLWASGFKITEFKLLDVYLSKINSHDPLNRTVVFDRKELCEIFGVTELKTPELRDSLLTLHKTTVMLDGKEESEYIVNLFSLSKIGNDENGVSRLELTCTPEAMKFFFNVESIGYIKYKINAITHITSLYSYLMFLYIEYNRFRKTWEVSVDDLRRFLNCEKAESYKEFKIFNRDVLKKTQKELLEKANCNFEYSTVKRGRTVTHIRFTVLPMFEENGIEINLNDQLNITETNRPEVLDRIAMACQLKFCDLEIDNIYTLVSTSYIPDYVKGDTEEDRQYNFVYMMFNKLVAYENRATGRKVVDRFNYFYKMLETEIKKAVNDKQPKPKPERKEQSYDIDEFENFAITFSKNTKKRE